MFATWNYRKLNTGGTWAMNSRVEIFRNSKQMYNISYKITDHTIPKREQNTLDRPKCERVNEQNPATIDHQ